MESFSKDYLQLLNSANTLADIGGHYAKEKGSSTAFTFLSNGVTETDQINFATLERKARSIATVLAENFNAGDRVLLLYLPGLEFIEAFLGCLYAKIVAVPAYIPQHRKKHWQQLAGIAHSAEISAILTTQSLNLMWKLNPETSDFLTKYTIITTDLVADRDISTWTPPIVEKSDLAFLQFTSGSTGNPKGVMVTHQALLTNQLMIANAFDHQDGVVVASWLPIYHDMGLIGSILQPFCLGGQAVFMPPVAFLQSPIRWLSTISKYKASTSGGPNFAYELCVNKISEEEAQGLDLSSWRVAFNGSEPVRAETMNLFTTKFAACKFHEKSFFPCYGLAEATLFVSGGPARRSLVQRNVNIAAYENNRAEYSLSSHVESKTLVSSGTVSNDIQISIIDPYSLAICEARSIGEIWLCSPSIAKGYFGNEVATHETFKNTLKGNESHCYLRTGDLGFYDEGELFITGRIKDMIIIRGRNLYPQDIESAVQKAHPAFRSGCGAAFSIDVESEERLVLVQEIDRTYTKSVDSEDLIRLIKQTISEDFGTQVHDIVLIKQATLIKTSSGKIERRTCKRQYLSGELTRQISRTRSEKNFNTDSESEVKNLIRNIVAKILRINSKDIDLSTSLLAYGLDSLGAVELHQALELQFSKSIPINNLLAGLSIDAISLNLPSSSSPEFATINPINPTRSYDIGFTHNQKALWTLYQIDPASSAYNVAFALRFDESLDINRLEKSLDTVLERHESLRATFSMIDDKFIQNFNERRSSTTNIGQYHFTKDTDFQDTIIQKAKEPFDLVNGPVFRANLFTQTDSFSVLLLSAHHIVIDLWSLSLIIEEIALLYSGGNLDNHPVPRPYSDFVRFSENSINNHNVEIGLAYWKKQLENPLPILNLPMDYPRLRHQTFNGASIDFKIEASKANNIKKLARDENCTQFTVLLAIYQTLLHRYTGATDICTGCPTAGRPDESFTSTVGYFVNPIVIRCQPRPDLSFLEFLNQIREIVASGLKYSNVPLQYLSERLDIKRESAIPPLFQTIFTVKRAHRIDKSGGFVAGDAEAAVSLGELSFRTYPLPCLGAQVDLSMSIVEIDDGYAIRIEYNSDLFKEETIKRLSLHFSLILDSVAVDPTTKLGHLNILTEEEKKIVGDWTTDLKIETQGCLHSLFENQVELQPNVVAIRSPKGELTYTELNSRANKIAHRIIKNALERPRPIAILMDDLSCQVESMLGILKSGHPFICLDVASPILRIREILSKALPTAILLNSAAFKLHNASLEEAIKMGCKLIIIDHEIEKYVAENKYNPNLSISESSAAYIVFTSGSTGTPKGIEQSHQSFIQFLKWQSRTFKILPGARVANWSSLIYDASYCEVFGALGFGATLYVTESSIRYNPVECIRWLVKEQISIFQTVPSFFNMILQTIESEPNRKPDLANLSHIMLAGETLRTELITAWQKIFGNITHIWNLYGPTESVLATYYRIDNNTPDQSLVPIGHAIDGRQILVLDENGEICPVGIPGEIFIRSPYLTMGYFQDPEQTMRSFRSNLASNDPKDRVFRTRDSGRWLSNGLIEFLGRLDGQVKIRGMRVETGEIEARLCSHKGIIEAAVKIVINNHNEPKLVAYIVSSENVDTQIMRSLLKQELPIFMIPDIFIQLPHLSRTATNKIDRRALPDPTWSNEIDTNRKAHLLGLEKQIADLWSDLLNITVVDIHANFFDLGGHSLKATRLVNKIRLLFHIEISLKDFFEDPTIAGVVEIIRRSRATNVDNLQSLLSILDGIENMSDEDVSSALNPSYQN